MRRLLADLLAREPALHLLGGHASGEEALERIPAEKPDVALVDINLPGMSGIECVARLKQVMPALQVLMLTTYDESEMIFESLRAGASGYLLKKRIPQEVAQAVTQVHEGGVPMSAEVARKVIACFRPAPRAEPDLGLTARELEILALLAKGALYKQIGDDLGITFHTVCSHVKRIYQKLHVQSRTEATLKYLGQAAPQRTPRS